MFYLQSINDDIMISGLSENIDGELSHMKKNSKFNEYFSYINCTVINNTLKRRSN